MIERMVLEAWDSEKQGVLLAKIGSEIAKTPELAKLEMGNRKLGKFIEVELKGVVQLLAHPTNSIVVIALPATVPIVGDVSKYFPDAAPLGRAAKTSGVKNAILLAFSRSLENGKRRFVSLTPTARFVDLPDGESGPSGSREVDRSLIVSDEALDPTERVRRVMDNIATWRQNADLAPAAIATRSKPEERPNETLLDALLAALSEVDQQRLHVPLDIVAKLLAQRVK